MPSSLTHSYFSIDVYNRLNKKLKGKLKCNKEWLKTFGQGPDPYFFYDMHLSKRSKKVFEINFAMQHTKINEHFFNLINYINEKNYNNNFYVLSYLYGNICHFVLDTTTHPYIIYYTGKYDNKRKETFKYNGLHEEMEYFIDIYLINKRDGLDPKKYKVYKEIFNITNFDTELKDTINYTVKKVYGFDDAAKKYYKSIMDMKKFYRIFNYDRFGLKKQLYKVMDFICGNKSVRKKELSFHVNPDSKLYYLNLEKKKWNHPCDKREVYYYSFEELYEKAVIKAVNIIEEVDKMLENKTVDKKRIFELFKDLDYGTGKDYTLNCECEYFKF